MGLKKKKRELKEKTKTKKQDEKIRNSDLHRLKKKAERNFLKLSRYIIRNGVSG